MFGVTQRFRKVAAIGALAGASTFGAACASVSQQQELQLGQQYSAQLNQELPIVNDASVNQYVNALGNQIARQGGRNLSYRFYVVNTDAVNAFAVPGGYVYVNRGLVEKASNMSELAGVIAHEIGHVENRHSVEQLERQQNANVGLTLAYILLGRAPSGVEEAAINVGGSLYFAKHSRQDEAEADASAVNLLLGAGIQPRGLVTFFGKLMEDQRSQPSQLEAWFSTHPTTQDRIDATQALITRIPAAQLRNLQTDSDAFHSMQTRLRRYPAPPPEYRTGG